MEHATALVVHDATTAHTCSCDKLVAAGWRVRCGACGRDTFVDGEPVATVLVGPAGRHTCTAPCAACIDELAEDEADFGSLVEAYDVDRDEDLVAAVERRVA